MYNRKSMHAETERKESERTIILEAISRKIKSLGSDPSFLSSHAVGNYDLKRDFSALTKLVAACKKIGVDVSVLESCLEDRKTINSQRAMEYSDIITALEIEKSYIEYLLACNKLQDAEKYVTYIKATYAEVPHPDFVEVSSVVDLMQARMAYIQYERYYSDIEYLFIKHLINKHEIEQAKVRINDADNETKGFSYSILLDYYKIGKNITGVAEILETVSLLIGDQDPHEVRPLLGAKNRALFILAELTPVTETYQEKYEATQRIEVDTRRVDQLIELLSELIATKNDTQAKKLLIYLLEEIDMNTGDSMENDSHSAVGSQKFTGKNQKEFAFSYERKIEFLLKIVTVIHSHPELGLLMNQILTEVEKTISSEEAKTQPFHATSVLEMYAVLDMWESVEQYYEWCLTKYSHKQDIINKAYARVTAAHSYDRAVSLIDYLPNDASKVDILDDLICIAAASGDFKNIKERIDTVVAIEDEILGVSDWDIQDVLELDSVVDDGDDEGVEKRIISTTGSFDFTYLSNNTEEKKFYRRSPALVGRLAKVAIQRGAWTHFAELVNDPRLSNESLPYVIDDVASWLTGERDIEHYW